MIEKCKKLEDVESALQNKCKKPTHRYTKVKYLFEEKVEINVAALHFLHLFIIVFFSHLILLFEILGVFDR